MRRLKILFVITGLAYGGAETQLVCLATRLKARGWNVCIASMLPPQAYVDVLTDAGIQVISLDMHRGVPDPRAIFRLAGIIRREQPQIIHSHMVHANLLSRLTRLLVKMPVLLCTAHNIYEGGRCREIAYRFTDFLCDLTTQVSEAGMEHHIKVRAVPRQKIRFVPNGVDVERFCPSQVTLNGVRTSLSIEKKFVWLAVGRFESAKDYPNMLQSFARVINRQNNTVLLIAGQGPLKKEMEQLAQTLNLGDKVFFLDLRKDIPELMNAADAYVMSSAWEGMPMVLLEAGAMGLPIVATDVGGNSQVVYDSHNGFLVPCKDQVALSEAMLRLMNCPVVQRQRMGRASRELVYSKYSLEHVVRQWDEIYQEILANKC